MKFLSQEFIKPLKEMAETDLEYRKKAMGLTGKFQFLVTSCADGVDKLFDIQARDGKQLSITLEEKPSPADFGKVDLKQYLFRGTLPYGNAVSLVKEARAGKLNLLVAVTSGKLKLEGSLVGLMPKVGALTAFLGIVGSVPAEY